MRIALCQLNPTVGDLEGNVRQIATLAEQAAEQGAELALFPELALCGYPPRDLLERPQFLADSARSLLELATRVPHALPVLVGCPEHATRGGRSVVYNAAALLRGGRVERVVRKQLLPSYDVFDEHRYFAAGGPSELVQIGSSRIGVTICEDAWNDGPGAPVESGYADNPVEPLCAQGADLLVNLAASPFTLGKHREREERFAGIARRRSVGIAFVNQVGANDDLIFDGASGAWAPGGAHLARLPRFESGVRVVDFDSPEDIEDALEPTREALALDALTLGVRDYVHKCGFRDVLIGLSGGIDSALCAAIAVRALGPEQVLGVGMPTRYTSDGTRDDALALSESLAMAYRVVPIDPLFQANLDELTLHLDALAPPFAKEATFENLQARIRCAVLMAITNRTGRLLLTTGNKSELATGYCTLYGDMAGGLAVISDLPKTMVYEVAREVNREAGHALIPESTFTRPPSAELRPDQRDTDSLPPYEVLDPILEHFIEDGWSPARIVEAGFDAKTVRTIVNLVSHNEYKRRQLAPGLIVTRKAFGPGRRYPIAHGYDFRAT